MASRAAGETKARKPLPSSRFAKHPTRQDRRHNPDSAPDQWLAFQRDRDRVLYSSALRRLAGVTQVVHAAEGHVFHNRLTHSVKVAQVGRRIAEYLQQSEDQKLLEAIGGIDPDVVETAGLSHDLGHPPFGHIAEEELDRLLIREKITDGFEGNPQSFRLVTTVIKRDGRYSGLNLTRACLNAILKYPWERGHDGKEKNKWGCYFSEKIDFKFARELNTGRDDFQSAEAAIMDWADDVTYSVHDIEDFYRAGIVPLDQILLDGDERYRFITAVYDNLE